MMDRNNYRISNLQQFGTTPRTVQIAFAHCFYMIWTNEVPKVLQAPQLDKLVCQSEKAIRFKFKWNKIDTRYI